jgi:hypothetical protein
MVDSLPQPNRRRADAHSVAETVASAPEGAVVKTFTRGGRDSIVYGCGCVAVDPAAAASPLQLLECPTHAVLHEKLRRRQSDRV